MAARPWEFADQVRAALHEIVADPRLGMPTLCSESQLASVLEDYLPDAPRERAVLVMAAKAGLAQLLHEYVMQGIDALVAVNLTSASFEESSPLDPDACRWVVTELALALGLMSAGLQVPGSRVVMRQPTVVVPPEELEPPPAPAPPPTPATPTAPAPPSAPATPAAPGNAVQAPAPWPPQRRPGRQIRKAAAVSDLAFSPDGQWLATASEDGAIRLWSVKTGTLASRLDGHSGPVRAVAFSPDGLFIATAGSEETRLWNGTLFRVVTPGPARGVAFSPDARLLVTAGGSKRPAGGGAAPDLADNSAWLWEVSTGVVVGRLSSNDSHASAVAFSPDGRFVATTAATDIVRLWDVSQVREIGTLPRRTGVADKIAFSPDGSLLATAGGRNATRLWNVATGTEVRQMTKDPARDIAFSPDGRLLATAGGVRPPAGGAASAAPDMAVRLWEVSTGQPVECPARHDGEVTAIAFSPAGGILAASSLDRTTRLWDLASGASLSLDPT